MTDNERLAKWQEWEEYHSDMNKHVPDYLNDDAAAMSLLDTLVERHYGIELKKHRVHELWSFEIIRDDLLTVESNYIVAACRDTRREAVVAACLELIERETLSGNEGV